MTKVSGAWYKVDNDSATSERDDMTKSDKIARRLRRRFVRAHKALALLAILAAAACSGQGGGGAVLPASVARASAPGTTLVATQDAGQTSATPSPAPSPTVTPCAVPYTLLANGTYIQGCAQ